MTVIAYDGRTVAADRQATRGSVVFERGKLIRLPNGDVMAGTGDSDKVKAREEWYANGAIKGDWPKFNNNDGIARLIVVKANGQAITYEDEPFPIDYIDKFIAWGDGADLAMGAMAAGVTAVQAVHIACKHNIYCGMGVDSYDIR